MEASGGSCCSARSSQRGPDKQQLIRREYHRMMRNSEKKITELNEEFFSPEYLIDQGSKLSDDIANLKAEIVPLNQELSRLEELAEKLGVLPKPDKGSLETILIAELHEEKKENAELDVNLAKVRRETSHATTVKLQYEIQEYTNEIQSFYKTIKHESDLITQRKNKLEALRESETAKRIVEQNAKIKRLESNLSIANNINEELREMAFQDIKNSAKNSSKARVDELKKKYEIIKTIRMKKNSELRKKKAHYALREIEIRTKIDEKKNQKSKKYTSKKSCNDSNKPSVVVVTDFRAKPKRKGNLPPLGDARRNANPNNM